MRWRHRRRSSNVDDRRGESVGPRAAGAAPLLLRLVPLLISSKGGRRVLVIGIVVLVAASFLGVGPIGNLLTPGGQDAPPPAARDELVEFVSVVLADTEETWHRIFEAQGGGYAEPTLVLFSGRVDSACGLGSAAMGPFYCPADGTLYLDLSFFQELSRGLGAPGDFAQAYVIAHEVGHHVQNLLEVTDDVQRARARGQGDANALSVALELQADCLAGVWGHWANLERGLLEPGDLQEALDAAAAIGDDRLQRRSQGHVVPDSFTHGTSEQRAQWFRTGFESGDMRDCNTFSG